MGVDRIEAEHVTLALTNRKLVFLSGPEGVTVELAQWD